jgi:hypothetical protein
MNDGQIEYVQDVTIENTHTFTFLYQMINSTSLILGGLLYFITIIRTKTENRANIGKTYAIINENLTHKNKNNRFKESFIITFIIYLILLITKINSYSF